MALNDFAQEKEAAFTTVTQELVFGGGNDLFGADELTKADLADPNFEVKFDADPPAGRSLQVDSIVVEVSYTIDMDEYDPTGVLPWAPSPYSAGAIGRTDAGIVVHVLVGLGGILFSSTDGGVTWVERVSGVADTIWGVTYADNKFIAAGENGLILVSYDGATWFREQSGTTEHLFAPIYDPVAKRYVVVGKNENKVSKAVADPNWSVRV